MRYLRARFSAVRPIFSVAGLWRIVEARAEIEAGFHGDVLHVLDAAGDLHVLAAGGDALGRLVDRLQAGAAVAIDGRAADLDRKAGDEGGHAGDVETLLAFLLDAAPVNVLDGCGRDLGPLERASSGPRTDRRPGHRGTCPFRHGPGQSACGPLR